MMNDVGAWHPDSASYVALSGLCGEEATLIAAGAADC